ncbi:MAG: hypothetical protein HYS57_03310 [Parcubacteria group bacterium]|nr:hypothetical protein [Parcubacteria group bacterium]
MTQAGSPGTRPSPPTQADVGETAIGVGGGDGGVELAGTAGVAGTTGAAEIAGGV